MSRKRRIGDEGPRGLRRFIPAGADYALLGIGMVVVAVLLAADMTYSHIAFTDHLRYLLYPEYRTAQQVISNTSRLLGVVLALSISLVSLAIPLTANVHTPRLIQLFIGDKGVRRVLSLLIVANVFSVLALTLVREGFIPRMAYLTLLLIAPICLLAVIPFIAYVFQFLLPRRIIDRLKSATLNQIILSARGRTDGQAACLEVLDLVETQANMAQKAMERMDRVVALDALQSLKSILIEYVDLKHRLPAEWFVVLTKDSRGYTREVVAFVHRDRLILEMHVFRQWELLMGSSVGRIPDVSTTIAAAAKEVAEAQVSAKDELGVGLTVDFFNTLLRVAITRRDVRGAYNIFYKYRLLAEYFCASDRPRAAQVAGHFGYYASVAQDAGLGFIAEIAAHDLASLVDRYLAAGLEARLVEILAGFPCAGNAARGVRAAQARAGAALLATATEAARPLVALFAALSDADRKQVQTLLLANGPEHFWEITDRRQNLYYLPPDERPRVDAFFARASATEGA